MMLLNEKHRLGALRLYRILDTAAEKAFDDLTRLAAALCEAPISLVSLVDADRQWFKSRHGLEVAQTAREDAFCAHAIKDDGVMVVEDAFRDERFAANPLVTGNPNIRFYAGAPLVVANGARLGTLCVIDQKPQVLTDAQRGALEVLRDAVVAQLELRRAVADLQALETLVPMCAWCRSVRTGDSGADDATWTPLLELVTALNPVTHCICPSCARNVLEDAG